ncbi:hypothetical protein AX14_005020, partial [Amanita brunnescens Koide BX004]
WRVGDDSLITVSTVYRWVNSAVEAQCHGYPWKEAESRFDLDVLTYSVHKNGAALSRESQEIIVPGDYGSYAIGDSRLYFFFQPAHSFSDMEGVVKANSSELSAKLPNDSELEARHYEDSEACNLSELMVVANVPSGLKHIVTFFWENKLGIDVDDNYHIVVFEVLERLKRYKAISSLLMDQIDTATAFSVCIIRSALLPVPVVATSWQITKSLAGD